MSDVPDSKAPGATSGPAAPTETAADPVLTPPDDDLPGAPDGAPADDEVAPDAVSATRAPRSESQAVAARPAPSHLRCFLAINFPMVTVRRIADEIAALRG